MTAVLPTICALSGVTGWTFKPTEAPAPTSVSPGNYTVKYLGPGAFQNQLLVVNSNIVTVQDASKFTGTPIWSCQQVGNSLCNVWTNSVFDSKHNLYGTLVSSPLSSCSAGANNPLSLATSFSDNVMLFGASDGSLYDPQCNVRYMVNDAGLVVPAPSNMGQGLWQFVPVTPPSVTAVSFTNMVIGVPDFTSPGFIAYLSASSLTDNALLTWVNGGQFNMSTCTWSYDPTKGTLATNNCSPVVYYVTLNSSNEFTLTQNLSQAVALSIGSFGGQASGTFVVWLSNSSGLGMNPQLTLNSGTRTLGLASTFSISTTGFQVLNMQATAPSSVASGTYVIQTANNECLNADGTLGTCSSSSAIWNYDSSKYQLSNSSGQFLTNPNTSCQTQNPLTVGSCNVGASQRFILGTDGRLFDPQLNLCYTAQGAFLSPSGVSGRSGVALAGSNVSETLCPFSQTWKAVASGPSPSPPPPPPTPPASGSHTWWLWLLLAILVIVVLYKMVKK